MNKAIKLDPLFPVHYLALGSMLETAKRYTEAESTYREGLELEPDGVYWHVAIAGVQLWCGNPASALMEMQLEKDETARLIFFPFVYYALGRHSESDAALANLKRNYSETFAYTIARLHAFRGEADLAFEWLERAYDQHDSQFMNFKIDQIFHPLADDPRYKAVLRKMRFPNGIVHASRRWQSGRSMPGCQ